MSHEEDKTRGVVVDHHHQQQQQSPPPPPPQYGTFQGVANYPPQPAIGFPQPVPPPGLHGPPPPPPPEYYAQGYQTVPGYIYNIFLSLVFLLFLSQMRSIIYRKLKKLDFLRLFLLL